MFYLSMNLTRRYMARILPIRHKTQYNELQRRGGSVGRAFASYTRYRCSSPGRARPARDSSTAKRSEIGVNVTSPRK